MRARLGPVLALALVVACCLALSLVVVEVRGDTPTSALITDTTATTTTTTTTAVVTPVTTTTTTTAVTPVVVVTPTTTTTTNTTKSKGTTTTTTPKTTTPKATTPKATPKPKAEKPKPAKVVPKKAPASESCSQPELAQHVVANKNQASYIVGATVTVQCSRGYKLLRSARGATPTNSRSAPTVKEATMMCTAGSVGSKPAWSIAPGSLTCVPAACADIHIVSRQLRVDNKFGVHGDVRHFTCDEPYTLEGTSRTICDDGLWSPSAFPSCFISQCDAFSPPVNGRAWITSNHTSPTKTLKYACDAGYKLVGPTEAYCLASHKWSVPPPVCKSFGLKPYGSRAFTFSAGSLSLDNAYVLEGVLASARHTPGCIGVTIARVDGVARAVLLKAHDGFLERRHHHDTYLFGAKGNRTTRTHSIHHGFAAPDAALIGPVMFGTDARVLQGIMVAVKKLAARRSDLIGFSASEGPEFAVRLATWASLPLQADAGFRAFTLQTIERQVGEVGCFSSDKFGVGSLAKRQLVPNLDPGQKATRLTCAARARLAGHKYFALSEGECFSGNQQPDRYREAKVGSCGGSFARKHESRKPGAKAGAFHTFEIDSALLNKGVHATRCRPRFGRRVPRSFKQHRIAKPLKMAHAQACQQRCSQEVKCHGASFNRQTRSCSLYRKIPVGRALRKAPKSKVHITFQCSLPYLVNGGFELAKDGMHFAMPEKRKSIHFAGKAPHPRGWKVSGPVGVAARGSKYSNIEKHTVPEGAIIAYMKAGGSLFQPLNGLQVGRKYRLTFRESFRVPTDDSPLYQAGLSLRVRVGHKMAYANLNVNSPLWAARSVEFVATSSSMPVHFAANDDALQIAAKEEFKGLPQEQVRSAILLDAVRVEPVRLRVERARASATGLGILADIPLQHPLILAAVAKMVRRAPNTVGFSIQGDEVLLVAKGLRTKDLVPSEQASVYFSNGTILEGVRPRATSGILHLGGRPMHAALRRLARERSNSLGYSLTAGTAFEARILASGALPFEEDAGEDIFLFKDQSRPLGCFNAQYMPDGVERPMVFKKRHHLPGGTSQQACGLAAAKAGHRYFALQDKVCVSGNEPGFKANGPSAACTLRCRNGRDICGGKQSAMVHRLPAYSRLSRGGHVSHKPRLNPSFIAAAREVFKIRGEPTDFISSNAKNHTRKERRRLRSLPPRADGTQPTFRHALTYHFPGSQRHVVGLYTVTAPRTRKLLKYAPSSWTLEGSINGRNWTRLDDVDGAVFRFPGQTRTYQLRNLQAASHFVRLVVTNNQLGGKSVGFAVSRITYQGRSNSLIQLAALYRFDEPTNPGFDSSPRFNDLVVFGQAKHLRVVQEEGKDGAPQGSGYLDLQPKRHGHSTYLAMDSQLRAPRGLPNDTHSFTVAFWVRANASTDDIPRGILSWGELAGNEGHSLQMTSNFDTLASSFNIPGDETSLVIAAKTNGHNMADKWAHFATTFDYDTGRHALYRGGHLVADRIIDSTTFAAEAANFKIGLTTLYGPLKDQFIGQLDDVAIFRGALDRDAIRGVMRGEFGEWLPLTCQQMSDRFSLAAGESWGTADEPTRREFLRARCNTRPSTCQTLSDVHALSPRGSTEPKTDAYALSAFKRLQCDTWPSLAVQRHTTGSCTGKQILVANVFSVELARRACLDQHAPKCVAYVWSKKPRSHLAESGDYVDLPANTLAMCDTKLTSKSKLRGSEVATRMRSYLVQPDTSNRCDEEMGKIVTEVMTNMDARALCDAQVEPPCQGYIWSGPRGIGQDATATPTPFTAMLCAGYRHHHATDLVNSGYETATVIGDYQVHANRYGKCSPVSEIATKYDVGSSLQARLHCDSYDGTDGQRCLSYVWDMRKGELRLCAGVPQTSLEVARHVETAWLRPESCAQISNRWSVSHNVTWGSAPRSVKQLYADMLCRSAPTPCQALSDFYGLEPRMSTSTALRVPGSIRDLWLAQSCATAPIGVARDRFKPAYQAIVGGIAAVETRLRQVDDLLTRVTQSKKATPQRKALLRREVTEAREKLTETLERIQG